MTTHSRLFNKKAMVLAIGSTLLSQFALADGRVSGRISDQEGKNYFEGAVVRIEGLKRETASAEDGRFSFNAVPAGTYELSVSYIGAEPVSVSVTVNDDENTIQAIKIGADVAAVENVIVRGQAANANRALNQMRSSDILVSVVTSDDIGQLPDENVSEALQRVAGVFIERDQGEGRYVGVRGIDSNLNVSSINGQKISSPESDRRSVALDVIPSELVESLSVSKTLTPDMDAEAIGGTIDVKSLTAFDRDGLFYKVSANSNYSELQGESGHKFSGSLTNVFDLEAGELGLAVSYSTQERVFGSENIEADGGWEDDFADDADNEFIAHEEMEARDYQVTREREGFALNLDYRLSEDTLLYSRYLYSLFGDQEYRNRAEYKLDEGDYPVGNVSNTSVIAEGTEVQRELKDRFEEQEIQSLLFGMETRAGVWDLEGTVGFSSASEDEPGRINAEFENSDVASAGYTAVGSPPSLSISADGLVPANYELKEIVLENNLSEDEHLSFSFDAKREMSFAGNPGFIKMGLAFRNREKMNDSNASVYEGDFIESMTWADFAGSDLDYALAELGPEINPSALRNFTFNNISQFELNEIDTEISNATDSVVQEDVSAAYVMSQVDINKWRVSYGLRVEQTDVVATGNNIVAFENEDSGDEGVDLSENRFEHSYTDILPSINARFKWNDKTIVRTSYYSSIGRPSFGFIRPTHEDVELVIENNEGELVVEAAGNPELEPFEADNFDLSIEYYPGGIGALTAGIFHKKIDNFIFLADIADAVNVADYFDFSSLGLDALVVDEFVIPLNGGSADITGVELAWTKAFESGFLVQTNATFSDSSADYPEREGESLPLVNQSDSICNIVVGYEAKGLSLRLSTSYQSERLVELDDEFNDLYENAHTQIDFSAKYDINDNWQVFMSGKNLGDEPFYTYYGERNRTGQYEEYGVSYEFGVTFRN